MPEESEIEPTPYFTNLFYVVVSLIAGIAIYWYFFKNKPKKNRQTERRTLTVSKSTLGCEYDVARSSDFCYDDAVHNTVPRQAYEDIYTDRSGKKDLKKPGKPFVVGSAQVDSICLAWESPKRMFKEHSYQLRYKEVGQNVKWSFHPQLVAESPLTLSNLKSDTQYIFQVRMVCNESEGPYSEVSDVAKTTESAAHRLLHFMDDVKEPNINIRLKKIPFQKIKNARNLNGKTRKLVVGDVSRTKAKEKTIMLVGATGTGKSTLVDGMMNYILGVNWNDPYRLRLVDLEDDEKNIVCNQAISQTQWITCYVINPTQGSRLDYTLNIIDTPGFGDTRGIERDKEIIEQIKSLFSEKDESGVVFIDAVCFLVKAPDARLTQTQLYIFNKILSLFGQDIKDNFCVIVTFADGKDPPVVSALKEANLLYKHIFLFNNSGLFANNSGENISSFSRMFWDMGCSSFQEFFRKLLLLETRSLRLSRKVLVHRPLIEITIDNLLKDLNAGLIKSEELREEIRILEDNKTLIEANKDFRYTVSETHQEKSDLPKGIYVTNCFNCHVTCHDNCVYASDEDKKKCSAMDTDGNCTQCPDNCFWNNHKNTPYIFKYVTIQREKTYTEKLEKYQQAENENMTRKQIVERMNKELLEMNDSITYLMGTINRCTNILRKIALRPDPLSVVEHIDLLIEGERLEKRPGFQKRIASLQQCRQRANVGETFNRFRKLFTYTTKTIADEVENESTDNVRKIDKQSISGLLDIWENLITNELESGGSNFMYF